MTSYGISENSSGGGRSSGVGNNGGSGGGEPDGLPPDLGKAGKATLKGIDSDNDGVCDDIQPDLTL